MNLKNKKSLLVTATAFLLVTGCDALTSTEKRLTKVDEALASGQLGVASIELSKVVEKEPANARARLLLAKLALRANDGAGAQAELERAKQAGADATELQRLQVQALLAQRKPKEAIAAVDAASNLTEAERATFKGTAQSLDGQSRDALASFNVALGSDPKSPIALAGRAEAQTRLGDTAAAQQSVDAALAADPKNWRASLVAAQLMQLKGNRAAAEKYLREALGSMGGEANLEQISRTRAAAAELAIASGQLDAAQQDVNQLQQLMPESPITHFIAARLALTKGDRREGISRLQKAVAQAPDFGQARLLLGAAQMEDGNLMQAQEQFQQAADLPDTATEAQTRLAQLRLRMGDAEGAQKAVMPALAANKGGAQVAAVLNAAAQAQGSDTRESIATLQRSFDANPSNASMRLALAQALLSARRPTEALKLVSADQPVGDSSQYWSVRINALNAVSGAAAAKSELDRLLAARPTDAALLTNGAGLSAASGDLNKAAELLDRAIKIDPKAANTVLARAAVERARGNLAGSEKILSDGLGQLPDSALLRGALADTMVARGEPDLALASLRAAPNANSSQEIQLIIGQIELGKGSLSNAESAFDRAVALAPGRAETYVQAGGALMRARQYRAALARFQKAAEMSPRVPTYALAVANAHLALGDIAAAREAAKKAGDADANNVAVTGLLVQIDLRDGKPDDAVRRAREWQSAHSTDAEATALLAQALAATGRAGESVPVLTQWLGKNPEDTRVRSMLGQVHLATGAWRAAADEFEKVAKASPQDAIALNNLAFAYQNLKDPRALATAERAYAAGPSAPVADTLGWMLVEQKQVERGLKLLESAAAQMPQAAEIQFHYGVALNRAGQRPKARDVLERAMTLPAAPPLKSAIEAELKQVRGVQ